MLQLSESSLKVLQSRYLLKDINGFFIETPDELFRRVAKTVASAELCWGRAGDKKKWEGKFYEVMSNLLFLPNSPTLMNAGVNNNQLSACFVLPIADSMNRIFTTLKNAALIQQSGGGTGFNFSHLRPKGDMVNFTGGTASGPVAFMKIFDAATQYIKQGGKRRGANMGILNVDHPDIEEFIAAKSEKGALANFNISVGISDAFMQVLEADGDWLLIHPNSNSTVGKVRAKKLWDSLIKNAWQTGDPGLIFIDTINRNNPTPSLGNFESTNPCGEVPLLSYEPCNLGSVNLSKFVTLIGGKVAINWDFLGDTVKIAIRFLDNVIDVNHYVIPAIRSMALGNRKIGLGVMGWADLLLLMQIPYESERAIELASSIMQFIQQTALDASEELASERSVFPNWKKSVYYPHNRLRNATLTSIAPTGSISIIADTSSSIEPLFALAFERHHVLNEDILASINPIFIAYLKAHGFYSDTNLELILKTGTADAIEGLSKESKTIFKTALEISPSWHLRHQLAFQQHTDNAVSKTINLPTHSTLHDVGAIYKAAWLKKAKGITVFRSDSKHSQVIRPGIHFSRKACKVCIE